MSQAEKNALAISSIIFRVKEEAKKADQYLDVARRIEEENDYSDAMQSMERTYAEGFADALAAALRIIEEEGK